MLGGQAEKEPSLENDSLKCNNHTNQHLIPAAPNKMVSDIANTTLQEQLPTKDSFSKVVAISATITLVKTLDYRRFSSFVLLRFIRWSNKSFEG